MPKHNLLMGIILSTLWGSCNNSSNNETDVAINDSGIISTGESVDDDFHNFIEEFSSDFLFQLSRIKFPLRVNIYDISNDRDSVIYINKSDFNILDFREKDSSQQSDQWRQEIVFDNNPTSATIEIRGIDNGIMANYLFEKVNGVWMLIEIIDSST